MVQRKKDSDDEIVLSTQNSLIQQRKTELDKEAIHLEIDLFLDELELESLESVENELNERLELAKREVKLKKLGGKKEQLENKIAESHNRVNAKKSALNRLNQLL